MIDPGSLALGALLVVAFVVAWFAWLARGHRLDLTGVRIVSTRDVPMGRVRMGKPIDPSSDDWAAWAELEQMKEERDEARRAAEKLREDYFAQAQERGE